MTTIFAMMFFPPAKVERAAVQAARAFSFISPHFTLSFLFIQGGGKTFSEISGFFSKFPRGLLQKKGFFV
ncbi:MAG: hypothetical protein IJQ31_06605 [Thermoguttaceae bacterium]|nr:hypothetical protein [Thermoguttaceae bacterium]